MIVDANVLLYTVDDSSPLHQKAHHWLSDALLGVERVGLPWISLVAFQRISTHQKIYQSPLRPEEAANLIQDWLGHPNVWVPAPGERHARIFRQLILTTGASGNLVTDAHLAALAIEHGASLCSFDTDFSKFPDLRWINPAD